MQHQDWNVVDVGRRSGSSLTKEEMSLQERQLRRQGKAVSQHRNNRTTGPANSKKLDEATEANKIEKLKFGKKDEIIIKLK